MSKSQKLNNHRKDVNNSNVVEACNYFGNQNHVFHGKFILIEQLSSTMNNFLHMDKNCDVNVTKLGQL